MICRIVLLNDLVRQVWTINGCEDDDDGFCNIFELFMHMQGACQHIKHYCVHYGWMFVPPFNLTNQIGMRPTSFVQHCLSSYADMQLVNHTLWHSRSSNLFTTLAPKGGSAVTTMAADSADQAYSLVHKNKRHYLRPPQLLEEQDVQTHYINCNLGIFV